MTDNTPLSADDELPRAVQSGMSMDEYETWMFLAGKRAVDEPYTYAVKQSDLTKFLRDYRKKHELQAKLELVQKINRHYSKGSVALYEDNGFMMYSDTLERDIKQELEKL